MGLAEQEAAALLDQIKQRIDPAVKKTADRVASTALHQYGVRVPELRQIAKAWYRAHKDIDRDDLFALVRALWKSGSREEKGVAFHLLEHYGDLVPDLPKADFEHWRQGLDSWVEVDGLGWMLALWLAGDADARLGYLQELIVGEDVWSRRLALVPLARINRGKLGFTALDLTLRLIDRVKDERHPMITKAASWVLRETIRTHRDEVAAYVDENCDLLAAHIVREVENKLRTGLKAGCRRQGAGGRKQEARGRRQEAGGKGQEAGGGR